MFAHFNIAFLQTPNALIALGVPAKYYFNIYQNSSSHERLLCEGHTYTVKFSYVPIVAALTLPIKNNLTTSL